MGALGTNGLMEIKAHMDLEKFWSYNILQDIELYLSGITN